MAVSSAAAMLLVNIAPLLTLEQLVFLDWYGTSTLPSDAVRPFQLGFLLFGWLSILAAIMLWFVVVHGVAKGERWAFHCYLVIGLGWPIGAIGVGLYTTAYWYLISAAVMTLSFTPPVFLLGKYMKPAV